MVTLSKPLAEMKMERPTATSEAILFSHNDMDGVGCGIIHKATYGRQAETHYCGYDNVDEVIVKRIREVEASDDRPKIFITDLGISPETARIVNNYGGQKVLLDHHKTNRWLMDEYKWAFIDESQCGTMLLYHFNFENRLAPYAELVRMIDDYDRWIHDNPTSIQMNRLFFIVGKEHFVERALDLRNPHEIQEVEELLLRTEDEKIQKYIDNIERTMQVYHGQDDSRFGIAFVDQHQSETAHELIDRLVLDVVVMIDGNRRKLSLRSRGDFDVGSIAKRLGGGGHKNAAGVELNSNIVAAMSIEASLESVFDRLFDSVSMIHYINETKRVEEMFYEAGDE